MKKLLVTGGAGFIGSHFIKLVLQTGSYSVINLDALTYAGNLDNLREIENAHGYTFVEGNICDAGLVNRLFNEYDIDYVVNFAAETHVDRSICNPQAFLETNIIGTQVLLEAAKKHWATRRGENGSYTYKDGAKFLQISTDEVYGALDKTNSTKFTEKSPLLPSSPYSASKASADMLVYAYQTTFGLPVNITRCSNNYGENQFPEKLIPLMISNCLREKPLPIYGDGMQVRDWIYVGDHCTAILAVLEQGRVGEIYNIGGNCERTNLDIVSTITRRLGKGDELITHVDDRPGHDRRYAIDSTKIQNELKWKPACDFNAGMERTISWYVKNTEWLNERV